ncbi:MAG: cytochrome c peroxidase [Sphaerobacter sp.]|nr:cytochrome c peroxidase [Sphaerobacter sp.]
MPRRPILLGIAAVLVIVAAASSYARWSRPAWTAEERQILEELWIGSLPELPPDPSNAVADDPRAVALGHRLFFDTRFSRNGQVACATCHQPARAFSDGRPRGQGVGTTDRRTQTLIGAAYSPWQFWDGRKDSQWAQALGPLESPVEHGGTRTQYARLIAEHYRAEYEAIFAPLPADAELQRLPEAAGPVADPAARAAWEAMRPEDRDLVTRIYVNMGKAIAAYLRQIRPGASRFDAYVEALRRGDEAGMAAALSADEVAGLRLFIGKAGCTECHSGPLFTNHEFHNVGVPAAAGLPADRGRALGAAQVLADEFNCTSPYSDARPEDCAELRFLKHDAPELEGAFKTPTLRNVAERAPYMHAGQFATLRDVLDHYNRVLAAAVGHSELQPLHLSETELAQLEAFLRALSAPPQVPADLLAPPAD